MVDNYGRKINYLRLSVTDRCNFRCLYCMPANGVEWLDHSEILSYEELLRLIAVFGRGGITNLRITGGEPLIRKGIVDFIAGIAAMGLITDLSLTTNGSLLANMAYELKRAGLNRVNISLDTINSERYAQVTTCGILADTLAGIESALLLGLTPVKLNVVLTEALLKSDIDYFIKQVHRYPIAVRFIEYMPVGNQGIGRGLDIAKVKKILNASGWGILEPAVIRGNGPAKYYRFPNSKGTFGFITPISEKFCTECNRLRLTADGRLKPCLLSNREIDIKTPLRHGACDAELAELFQRAVQDKPASHSLYRFNTAVEFERKMSQIGG